MKKLIFTILVISLFPLFNVFSQPAFYSESFETSDSIHLPSDWFVFNNANFPIDPLSNWTVRDSGVAIPGIEFSPGRGAKSYDGTKSIMVSWNTSIDTNGTTPTISDAYLVTKLFTNLPPDAKLSFYASGGSTSYADSMQIWISNSDSLPSSFVFRLGSISWPEGSVYGNFTHYQYDLAYFAGMDIRIAFRYNMDCAHDGFVVFVDKVQMLGTVGINQIGTNLPKSFALHQNYPNPFNPTTTIKFDIPRSTQAKIEVYNNLGQLVKVLHDGYTSAGYFETQFDAGTLSSGVYFYRLTTPNYVETKKMILVK
ncbi:MAG: T9SS type A sorting domain-containing protein [Bacteroidetes bacterium]|nr:T9SS type A sorting domain-containing protein [Bacteroidota bacterium]